MQFHEAALIYRGYIPKSQHGPQLRALLCLITIFSVNVSLGYSAPAPRNSPHHPNPGRYGHSAPDANPTVPWLELPDASAQARVDGNDSLELTQAPQSIQRLVLHIPRGGSHIDYGKVHAKVNTESADGAMTSTTTDDGLSLRIDLGTAGGFPFRTGRNSVELEYEDRFGRAKYYNFVVNLQTANAGRDFTHNEPPPPPARGHGRLLAVVIGISHYGDSTGHVPDLRFADQDAIAVANFLKSPAGGAIQPQNLQLLLNQDATVQNVRHALFTFLTTARAEDTVVIYIAGHGAPDPHDPRNLYFIAADSKADDMGGTAFPMWQIQDVFGRILKAERVITIVDTCHSYGFSGLSNGQKTDGNNLFNQYLERYASTGERAVITASDVSELSYEDTQWGGGHGVFTWFLLQGLEGSADTNHDGAVTAGELFAYLQRTVSRATSGKQNPRAMEGIASSLVLSNNHTASAHLSQP